MAIRMELAGNYLMNDLSVAEISRLLEKGLDEIALLQRLLDDNDPDMVSAIIFLKKVVKLHAWTCKEFCQGKLSCDASICIRT